MSGREPGRAVLRPLLVVIGVAGAGVADSQGGDHARLALSTVITGAGGHDAIAGGPGHDGRIVGDPGAPDRPAPPAMTGYPAATETTDSAGTASGTASPTGNGIAGCDGGPGADTARSCEAVTGVA